jgi:hypothetical protein
LYLTCSLLFFGAIALAPDVSRNLMTVNYRPSPGDPPVDAETIRQWEQNASAAASSAIVHDLPRVMFALMIHFHAFVCLVLP